MIQGSTNPQEVDKDKEIIFTYDVSFKVLSFSTTASSFLNRKARGTVEGAYDCNLEET